MFQRAEKVGTKSPAFRIGSAKAAAGKNTREELLRQFSRRIFVAPLATEKPQHRLVIRLAQFTQRPARLGAFTSRAQDERPARGGESGRGRGVHFVAAATG